MIILSSGDSFTYGSELLDEKQLDCASSTTWIALLAARFGFEYECVAKPGAGNDYISRALIERAHELRKQNKKFAVAVMWTYSARIELRVNKEWHQMNSWFFWDGAKKLRKEWEQIPQKFFDKLQKKIQVIKDAGHLELFRNYMKHTVLTGDYAIIKSYQQIFSTSQYLKYHNIPFFFVNATKQAVNEDDYKLYPDIHPYYDSFDATDWLSVPNFYDWAKENNYEITLSGGHPLERAHVDYANLLLKTGLIESKWRLI